MHAPGKLAVGERETEPARRALRCADAGHHLDRNAGRAAGRKLLAGATENQRIAALQTHHVFAGLGERHHQRIDLVLLAGGRAAGLADQHLLGLAPGEVENFRRHQVVDQDHIGRLQGAYRAQREQLRIAGPGTNQRDRAAVGRGTAVARARDEGVEIGLRRFAVGMGEGMRGENAPEAAPAGKAEPRCLHRVPPAPRRRSPARKAARNERFQARADRLREHRCAAVGRHADDKRRAVDDGAEGEVAIGRLVDDIDRDAGLARGARKTLSLLVALESTDRDGCAGEVRGLPVAQVNDDRALRRVGGHREHLVGKFAREHVDFRTGG